MRRTLVVAAALGALLIVLAAGCGSKKSASSSPTTTTNSSSGTSTEATTNEATTTEATTTTSSGSNPSFASTKNCAQLASLASKLTNSVGGQVDLKGYSDAMDALANAAPDEIKSDFKTFAEAFKGFASAMSDAGLKPGETPTAAQIAKLSAASQKLSTPKIQAATRHLEAWGQKNCGLSSTSP
jgi:hypothetical protein